MKILNKKMIYIIVIAAIVFSLLLAWSITFVVQTKDSIDQEIHDHIEEISSKNTELVTTRINTTLKAIESIAYDFSERGDITDISAALIKLNEKNAFYEFKRVGIIFAGKIDKNGKFVKEDYTNRNSKLYINYSSDNIVDVSNDTYGYLAFEGKSNISESFLDTLDINDERINIFSAPIYNKGKVIGVISAIENVSTFSQYMKLESFGGAGMHLIVNKNGIVVASDVDNTIHCGFDIDDLFVSNQLQVSEEIFREFKLNLLRGVGGSFVAKNFTDNLNIDYDNIGVNNWYSIRIVSQKKVASNTVLLAERITVIIALAFSLSIALIVLMTILDKTNRKMLENIAYGDAVTGHSNWRKFKMEAEKMLKENPFTRYCIIAMDIDKFKVINDIYGHENGNAILKKTIDFCKMNSTKNEVFARVSGDNFNILAEFEDEQSIITRINKMSSHMVNYIDGYIIELSFGIYIVENTDMPIDIMSDRASLAKSTIKTNPEINYAFFNSELRSKIIEDKELENDMDNALNNGEILVYLQPKFSFSTGKIVGAEALARWKHPTKGLLMPDKFIPLFERNGFIKKLDIYMFNSVCKLLSSWTKELPDFNDLVLSVNFSRAHVANSSLINLLEQSCLNCNIDTSRVEIEITENALFNDIDQIKEFMRKLKEKGFMLSIDDFGSGYSSLNALMEIPADIIKLDKGFLNEATVSVKGRNIISSLISMIKSMGLTTVAEGVEYQEQADFLKSNLCDIAQGYLYAKPMPISEFEKLIDKVR